jgi:hypothetical protein
MGLVQSHCTYSVGMTKPTSDHRGLGLDSDAGNANPEQKYLKYWSFANFGTFWVFGANLVRQKIKRLNLLFWCMDLLWGPLRQWLVPFSRPRLGVQMDICHALDYWMVG